MRNERRMSGSARGDERPTAARPARRSSPTLHLRCDALHERKRQLKALIAGREHLLYCDHIEEHGEKLFRVICKNDLEGIVAKPRNSPYLFSDSDTPWLKIKNRDYSQSLGRDDLFAPAEKKAPKVDWAACALACAEMEL